MTRDRTERILEILDQGIGSSAEDGYGAIIPDRCARCVRRDPVEDSDFCGPCRAFLLGDGPDPVDESPRSGCRLSQELIDSIQPVSMSRDGVQTVAMEQFLQEFIVGMTSIVESFIALINDAAPVFEALADLFDPEPVGEPTPELVEAMGTYGTRPPVDGSQLERFNQIGRVRDRDRFTYRPVCPRRGSYSHSR